MFMRRIIISLIIVALIAGIVGCGGATESYALAITSTEGGSVTTPGEGTFIYDAGTVVGLNATPGIDHRFDKWTGDVGTVADVYSASTNITMIGNYSVTANLRLTLMVTAGG